jgi:hypothetical protein
MEWKLMWKNCGNENLKATIPSTNHDRSEKRSVESGIF